MKKYLYLLFLLVLACKQVHVEPKGYEFPKEEKLVYSSEITLCEDFLLPQSLFVWDSLILVQDKINNSYFHIYNTLNPQLN